MTLLPRKLQLDYFMLIASERGQCHHKKTLTIDKSLAFKFQKPSSRISNHLEELEENSESRSRSECKETVCPALPTLHPDPRTNKGLDTHEAIRVQDQKKWSCGMSKQKTQGGLTGSHHLHSVEPMRWVSLTSDGKNRLLPGCLRGD